MTYHPRFCRRHGLSRFLLMRGAWLIAGGLTAGAALAQAETWRVAFDLRLEPVGFLDAQGQPAGFVADYVRLVAKEANVEVKFVTGSQTDLQREFVEGRVDVIAGVVFTEARAQVMDFALPYLTLQSGVFARKGIPAITSPADFAGRKIAVVQEAVTHRYFLSHPEWHAQLVPVRGTEAAIELVQNGGADFMVGVAPVVRKLIHDRGLNQVQTVDFPLPELSYRYYVAVRKGDTALQRRISEAQLAVHERGDHQPIYERWIGPLRTGPNWRQLRPLLVPAVLVLAAIAFAFAWQRKNLAELSARSEQLRFSEERLNLVLAAGGHSLWDWDVAENRVMRSPMLAHILGYTPDEIPPTPAGLSELLHPDDAGKPQSIQGVLTTPGPDEFTGETRLRTKSGGWRWIATKGRVLKRGPAGHALRAVGTHTDITPRKEAEAAILKLNQELEARVSLRTGELAARVAEVERLNEEQRQLLRDLRASQQSADRAAARLQEVNASLLAANQELESFSYSVSHDLRAPLRNITGFLELLTRRVDGQLDGESARFVTVVGNEAKRMGLLIDDLLTFSRIGRTEMKREPVALDPLVADVRAELQPDIGERQIEWHLAPLPVVHGDATLLRQVIANLASNAVKFTRHRPVARIDIGATPLKAGETMVTCFVRDNGAGFNPRYLDKLFGVFQRLHNARDFEGTGIGLANVKRIVTRHGGRVWAEGDVDKGAVFYFTLPVVAGTTA